MMFRTMLILVATGLMACDSDNPSGTDTNEVTTPDVVETDTTPDVVSDVSVPDTASPDTTTADTTAAETTDTTEPVDTTEPADTGEPADTSPEVLEDTASPDTDTSAGACDNTADFNTLASVQSTLEDQIQTCAFSCLGQGAPCAASCIERETALSTPCSACFGEVIACTISNCALQCIDASSAGCTTCRDTNCTPAFEACAGIEQP